jgi:hypothetical protein
MTDGGTRQFLYAVRIPHLLGGFINPGHLLCVVHHDLDAGAAGPYPLDIIEQILPGI